jgi:hypothetical protein
MENDRSSGENMTDHQFFQTKMATLIAVIVIVGGMVILFVTRNDAGANDLRILIGGFMGAAIQWAFGAETSSRVSKQTERSYAAGVAVPTVNQPDK